MTSLARFTAMQRSPSNLISKVHFSPTGSTVTGLHCIGSMNVALCDSELVDDRLNICFESLTQ